MSKEATAWFNGWPVVQKGGPGSGFHAHGGRPGQRGGSAPASTGGGAVLGERPDAKADRKMYEPTKNQERKWAKFADVEMPSDEEFKARGKKEHKPWGLLKRNYVLGRMTQTREYQVGIWQGRVDRGRDLNYSEERSENVYNLGYYRGYTGYKSDRKGWDRETRARFDKKYLTD
jgi:hypothetical protein